ncbi:MAG: hypothetical protein RL213_1472 [Bacteroidota bacterium]|jgi:hypothetical protein
MHSDRKFSILARCFCLASIVLGSCGSDRAGDEIGTLQRNRYPETFTVRNSDVFAATGLTGPEDRSEFPVRKPSDWHQYESGSSSRLAILLTDPNSSWIGLAQGLKTIGVPFIITDDYRRALSHKVVLVYPMISGKVLSYSQLQALSEFPKSGGTLIGTQVLGGLNEVFGFDEAVPSRQHFEILLRNDSSAFVRNLRDPKELRIPLGNKERFKETIGTYSYSRNILPPLATYEDRSAAICRRYYANGKAIAFGFDIGYMILKGNNNRHEDWNHSSFNSFEPGTDVILRMLRNIYLEAEQDAAYLCTVPYNKELSVVITHNVNYRAALDQGIAFAEKEKKAGIRSSYFIQTKYVRDRQRPLFNSVADLEKIAAFGRLGMEVQSNSVSNSYYFDQFEQGTGSEVYPGYRPYVYALEKTYGGSVFGEMRVSRFLVDRFSKSFPALAFRSSYQYTPFTYPQSLLSSGYRFGSTMSANMALTHFPVQMTFNREYDQQLEVFEFPLTDDDELPPYDVQMRTASADLLANRISRYGGCYIGQVHATENGWKVEESFFRKWKDRAWFGSMGDFGLWWTARNYVTMDVKREGGTRVVYLNVPKRMEGLAVMLPVRSTPVAVQGGGPHSIDGKLIIFEIAEGPVKITLNN